MKKCTSPHVNPSFTDDVGDEWFLRKSSSARATEQGRAAVLQIDEAKTTKKDRIAATPDAD